MRWRVEYEKGPVIRFLSHLDMVRLWERLLRRSNFPLQLTQGFNPHLKISLGTVLPVGLWGKREYLDMELEGDFNPDELQSRLQEVAPPGINVRRLGEVTPGSPSLMAVVNASAYRMAFPLLLKDRVTEGIQRMDMASQIMITRKKDQREFDIRPGILSMEYFEVGGKLELEVLVPIGNQEAVRFPELIVALVNFGLPHEEILDTWREANYIRSNGNLSNPLELK
jgi:radical SAM-linked protein